MNRDEAKQLLFGASARGFNACRDIVWNGPTVSGFKTVVDSTIPPDEARLVVNGKVVGTVRGLK